MVFLVRFFFVLTVLAISFTYAFQQRVFDKGLNYVTLYILVPVIIAFGLMMVDWFWKKKRLQALSGLFFGLLAGMVIAYLLGLVVDLVSQVFSGSMDQTIITLVKVLLGAGAVFICVSFVLQTKDDFRFVIPYVEFSHQAKGVRPTLLDTSVIIDGRIADIVETGILEAQIVIPRFILSELQGIADSDDKLKRNRGRRGLDVLNKLRANPKIDISIMDEHPAGMSENAEVDAKLVALAAQIGGRVVTNDYNLNKIAQLRGVGVLNINDLANALKPIVLPGETMRVKILKPGEEAGQGVGYLEDGTMVVAEQGREHLGKEVTITVTSVLQTSAGRMIFGRLDAEKPYYPRDRRS